MSLNSWNLSLTILHPDINSRKAIPRSMRIMNHVYMLLNLGHSENSPSSLRKNDYPAIGWCE